MKKLYCIESEAKVTLRRYYFAESPKEAMDQWEDDETATEDYDILEETMLSTSGVSLND